MRATVPIPLSPERCNLVMWLSGARERSLGKRDTSSEDTLEKTDTRSRRTVGHAGHCAGVAAVRTLLPVEALIFALLAVSWFA